MVRRLYVIVGECSVHMDAGPGVGNPVADEVLAELRDIKDAEEHIEIPSNIPSSDIDPRMPPPSDDLKVIVCGGYREACCKQQYGALSGAGYQVDYHSTACLSSSRSTLLDGVQRKLDFVLTNCFRD